MTIFFTKTVNKMIVLLIGILMLIIISLYLLQHIPQEFLGYFFSYGLIYQIVVDCLIFLSSFGIFIRANYIYSKIEDNKNLVIAAGFLALSMLYLQEFSVIIDYYYNFKFAAEFPFFYMAFGHLIGSVAIFISLFYLNSNKLNKKKVYLIFLGISISIYLIDYFFSKFLVNLPVTETYQILTNISISGRIAEQMFYLLTFFIYIDIFLVNNKPLFSKFNIGLFVLGIFPIFIVPLFYTTLFSIFNPILKIIGYLLILSGLQELQEVNFSLNFRQKLAVYLSLFLTVLYLLFVLLSSILLKVNLPLHSQFLFLIIIITAMIIQYLIAEKLTQPITLIMSGIEKYTPSQEPLSIKVISHDEIGTLAEKLNDLMQTNWEYTQKLLKNQEIIEASNIKEKQISKREKLRSEILGNIKKSSNIDKIYYYITQKIGEEFNVDRVVFMESPLTTIDLPKLKYEYLPDSSSESLIDKTIPDALMKVFMKKIDSLRLFIIYNLKKRFKNKQIQDFLNDYSIETCLGIPFVRYNQHHKIIGILLLFNKSERKWTLDEITTLKSIAESTVTVIWEVIKIIEIEKLRDSFVSTLAHDLQVPIIGEKKYLEFLKVYAEKTDNKSLQIMLDEMISNNININNLLSKLIDIFNYESGKIILSPSLVKAEEIIEEVISPFKTQIKDKQLSISINISMGLPKIRVDFNEVVKALKNIIKNSIEYTEMGGIINIKSYQLADRIIIEISDNGIGIDDPDIIFDRFAIIKSVKRKVGSGLSLYLTKLIIEAQKGTIWFESEKGTGSSFFVSFSAKNL